MPVGLAYVGAVVGAGFASGQEIYQFFSRHGAMGTWGMVLSGALFFLLGRWALLAGARGRVTLPNLLAGHYRPPVAAWLDRAASVLLAAGLVVAAAAGGSVLQQLAGIPAPLASLATLIGVVLVAARGSSAVLSANAVLVPALLLVTAVVAGRSPHTLVGVATPGWWLSAGLYVSYNLFTGLVVLLALGATLPAGRGATRAAALGAGLLTALGLAIHSALLAAPAQRTVDLPLLALAQQVPGPWWLASASAMYAALFTTGVAQAFALATRHGRGVIRWAVLLWPLSWLGFAGWVRWGYPVMGVVALWYVWPLVCLRQTPAGPDR
ncbi:MAG: hypothetical protein M0Z54_01515 [Thermaerobacter sp.]|nr:hypothetical protein [Thermaerobacter sp.]